MDCHLCFPSSYLRKRFLILAVIIIAVGGVLFFRISPVLCDSKGVDHPSDAVVGKQNINPLTADQQIRTLAKSPAEFTNYLRGLETKPLLDLAPLFLKPQDKGILHYGIGSELLRRFRTDGDVSSVLKIVEDPEETAELRQFGFELLDTSFRYVDEQSQRQILNAGTQVAFIETDATSEVRQSALICANHAILNLSAAERLPSDEVDHYCERLDDLSMDKSEDGNLRGLAIDGLGKLQHSEAEAHLLTLLESEDDRKNPPVARAACLALARFGAHDALPAIGKVLQDTEDPRIYGSAALSIGRIGGEEALRFLVNNADRFDTGSCGVAINKQKDKTLQILSDAESPYLSEAIRATQYLYNPDDVNAAKKKLMNLLPQLRNDEEIGLALSQLYQVGTKEDFTSIVNSLPRKPGYGETWDAIYIRAISVPVKGQTGPVPTDESGGGEHEAK